MGAQHDKSTTSGPRGRRSILAMGESLSAPAGVASLLIMAVVLAASGWWTLRVHREGRREDDARRVQAVGTLLATSAEALLEKDEISLLRGLVMDTARRERLSECRVLLRDGTVIADSDVRKLSARTLPETWATTRAAGLERAGWQVFPVEVRGRGPADLILRSDETWSPWGDAKAQFGLGVISAGGLVFLLVGYRYVRLRLRGAGAVAEAVERAAGGEMSFGALRVHEEWGRTAAAWNQVAAERERLSLDTMIDRTIGSGETGKEGGSDLGVMFDAMSSGLVLIDGQQRVCRVNGAAGILLQAKPESLVGVDARRVTPQEKVISAIEAVLSGKTRQTITEEVSAEDTEGGGSVLRYRIKPVRREAGMGVLLVIDDVTQQRIADQSRNAFVAQATHELRTPLTSIRLYMDALLEDGEQDVAARAKALNIVSQEARRLERIVADMLSVSEIEAGSMKLVRGSVRLDALFEELENDYRAQAADKEIALEFKLPPKWPVLEADRDKLSLALHNLIVNAIKYTPTGGKVSVVVEEGPQGLTVDVRDNGIGIRPEEHEKIFDRFYRAKDKRLAGIVGSGLGLPLAREIARLHGGDVTLQSELDKGSTFRLVVPLSGAEAAAPIAKAA